MTPQGITTDVFARVDNTACTLYVPQSSLDLYRTAEGWKDFTNIIGMDVSGVEATNADDVKIAVNGTEITVEGVDEAERVEVYSINGQLIYSGNAQTVGVAQHGVYIVKVAGVTRKVVL